MPDASRSPLASITPLYSARRARRAANDGDPRAAVTCFLATTPRSGSWLLSELLDSTGLVGEPHEYFRPDFLELWAAEWGLSAAAGLRRYVDAALARTSTPNGVFAAKLHWYQLVWLTTNIAAHDGVHAAAAVDLADWFPAPRYVRLRRRDTARQAISYYRAATTGVWYRTDDARRPVGAVDCDLQQIRWFEDALVEQDGRWRTYLDGCGATPLDVWYEDVVADRSATVTRVLEFLGLPHESVSPSSAPRLRAQADDTTDRILARYLAARDDLEPKPASTTWRDDVRRFVVVPPAGRTPSVDTAPARADRDHQPRTARSAT